MNAYKPNRHRVRADTLLFVEYGNDATETSFVVLHLRTYVLYHSPTAVSTFSRPFFTFLSGTGERSLPLSRGPALLPFPECRAVCFSTVTCSAASDIHMLCRALAVRIIDALHRLTVNGNRFCRIHGIGCRISFPLPEAFTAGFVLLPGVFAAHKDIPFTTQPAAVVGTVVHRTFQFRHNSFCLLIFLFVPPPLTAVRVQNYSFFFGDRLCILFFIKFTN